MLPDRDRQLLTAYVDGELTGRQRRHVARLLERSDEARRLLQKLQEDSGHLRQFQTPPLGSDLSIPVLRQIAGRRLSPRRQVDGRIPSRYPAWAGAAAAAAILLVTAACSYFLFASALSPDSSRRVARNQQPPSAVPAKDKKSPGPGHVAEGPKGKKDDETPRPDGSPSRPQAEAVQQPGEKSSTEEANAEPVITAPSMEMFKLETFNVTLPVTVKLRELDQEAARQKVLDELKQDTAFRLELPCKDGTRAFERFEAAWKARGNSLLVDQVALGRTKQPKWKTNYVLVAEDLTPEELLQLMKQLAAEDRKGEAKKPPDVQFDSLVLTRMTKHDHKELSDLLGIDLTQTPPKATGPLGTDPKKPLSEATAEQVAKALAGEGGVPRPEPGKPAAKPLEHLALALAYNPVRPRPGSTEVKRFLESRKPARPGTVRVLLVLRGTGS
jgi:anti-sigma factor RsiW